MKRIKSIPLSLIFIYVSAGSACSLNKKGESHVLRAMGLSKDEIEGALRFSLSGFTTEEELDYTLDKLKKLSEACGYYIRWRYRG